MKIILLFDSDKLENRYREYELLDKFDKDLRNGCRVSIEFCHPAHGEVMEAKSWQPSLGDKMISGLTELQKKLKG